MFRSISVWPICLALVLAAVPASRTVAGNQSPNIVVIVADDQAYTDFGFMGHDEVRTPNLDRLADRSAVYPNGYVPASVCRPSLASLLTGQYPHEHGIHFNHPPPGFGGLRGLAADKRLTRRNRALYLIRRAPTLARRLSEAGYRTFQAGKHWEGAYRDAGFTDGMTLGKPAPIEEKLGLISGHGTGDRGLTIGRRTMEPIEAFLDEVDGNGTPFFLWYAPMLPHTPHNAPASLLEPYRNDPDVPDHAAAYYAACTWFDRSVGHLLDELKRRSLRENTLVAFLSDNGWAPRENRPSRYTRRSKRSPFETGVRTPVLLSWPGHTEPGRRDGLVSSVDLAPTLLRAAGVEPPEGMSGRDLLPSARGERSIPADRAVFGEIYPGDARKLGDPAGHVAYRWVRRGRWKLIVPQPRGDDGRAWHDYLRKPALFDVIDDPRETTNVIEKHPETAKKLRDRLDAWWSAETDPVPPPPDG